MEVKLMAGIGFELKKLFNGKGLIQGIRACFLSMLVAIGPTLLCILMMTVLQKLLYNWGASVLQRELFMATVIYSFTFSLILTSAFTMILSRYISDKIYKKEYKDILPSLKGAITVCILIGCIIGIAFYWRSPLNLLFKLAAYTLFIELNILWLQTLYVSALKDYMKLVKGFFTGVSFVFLFSYILVNLMNIDAVTGVLASIDIGFFIIILFFANGIQSFFCHESRKFFDFLEYFDRYPSLFFIGIFYAFGLYVHNFLFWASGYRTILYDTYIFAPFYDVPAFWAFLTVTPAMVIFVVSFETSFYVKCKVYYNAICNGGLIEDIDQLQNEMIDVVSRNLRNIMGIQLLFTIFFLDIGMIFLPLAGLENKCIDIFNVLVIGNYAFIIMFICFTVLLYFDDRKGALMIVCFFILANAQLTRMTILMGENYYGLGFMTAAFLSLAIGFARLNHFLNNIRYFIFCSQPITQHNSDKLFTWISRKLNKLLNDS